MTSSLAAGAPAVAEKHGVAQKTSPTKRQKGAIAPPIIKRHERAAISVPHSVISVNMKLLRTPTVATRIRRLGSLSDIGIARDAYHPGYSILLEQQRRSQRCMPRRPT